MKVYVHRDGKNFGPYSVAQLREYLKAKNFTGDDLACYDGANWVKLSLVPGISENPLPAREEPELKDKNPARTSSVKVRAPLEQQKALLLSKGLTCPKYRVCAFPAHQDSFRPGY